MESYTFVGCSCTPLPWMLFCKLSRNFLHRFFLGLAWTRSWRYHDIVSHSGANILLPFIRKRNIMLLRNRFHCQQLQLFASFWRYFYLYLSFLEFFHVFHFRYTQGTILLGDSLRKVNFTIWFLINNFVLFCWSVISFNSHVTRLGIVAVMNPML